MEDHAREGVNLRKGAHPWWLQAYAAWAHVTKTGVVHIGALQVISVFVTSMSNACTVFAYDGENATAPSLSCFDAQANRTMPFVPGEPILLHHGLFLVLSGDVECVFVQYRPMPKDWRP